MALLETKKHMSCVIDHNILELADVKSYSPKTARVRSLSKGSSPRLPDIKRNREVESLKNPPIKRIANF